jgi:hypothetical protein
MTAERFHGDGGEEERCDNECGHKPRRYMNPYDNHRAAPALLGARSALSDGTARLSTVKSTE